MTGCNPFEVWERARCAQPAEASGRGIDDAPVGRAKQLLDSRDGGIVAYETERGDALSHLLSIGRCEEPQQVVTNRAGVLPKGRNVHVAVAQLQLQAELGCRARRRPIQRRVERRSGRMAILGNGRDDRGVAKREQRLEGLSTDLRVGAPKQYPELRPLRLSPVFHGGKPAESCQPHVFRIVRARGQGSPIGRYHEGFLPHTSDDVDCVPVLFVSKHWKQVRQYLGPYFYQGPSGLACRADGGQVFDESLDRLRRLDLRQRSRNPPAMVEL